MIPEQISDRAIRIGKTVIPAVNIQVENHPKIIDGEIVPLYFEINFETGWNWTVYSYLGAEWQDSETDPAFGVITVESARHDDLLNTIEVLWYDGWEAFVNDYKRQTHPSSNRWKAL